jgi:hypothetical protein
MLNAADLATLVTVVGCSVVAGLVAGAEKAGWFTIIFVFGGFAVGFAFGAGVHKLAYWLLRASGRQARAFSGWAMLFAYTFVPLIVAFGAMAVTGCLTFWLVRHALERVPTCL